jgi:tetratricopeptide (TPR) repeat protein
MLADLADLLERRGDFAAAAAAHEALAKTMTEKRDQLLYGNGLLREELEANLARAYEHLGRARLKTKEYDRAVAAFRSARDTLLKSEDPQARHAAVRINWNLSELFAAQGQWAQALDALDAYLEHSPAEIEPYEKKVELLRKLGRDRDVVPALRRYSGREEFNIRLQLLLAQELGKEERTHREAEQIYRGLSEKHVKPEIYRGLFRLYQTEDRMVAVIDLVDDAVRIMGAKDGGAKADEREVAAERYRAMLAVLRSDPALVGALIEEIRAELNRPKKREVNTWELVAFLAARARKLEDAETVFRQCLRNLQPEHEQKVYLGLIRVLSSQRKYGDIVTLCRTALASRANRGGL